MTRNKNRDEGEKQFKLDRDGLLVSTLCFAKGRFDPFLANPIIKWMRDSVEHRRWPPSGTTELDSWGVGAVKEICNHFLELSAWPVSTSKKPFTSGVD